MNIKTTFFYIFTVLFMSSISVSAQNIITGTKSNIDTTELSILNDVIREYQIVEIDILKKNIDVSEGNNIVTLTLGANSYDLNLYDHNLTLSAKYDQQTPHLLGGSLRQGGAVSIAINDNFIFGFIKYDDVHLFIEPLRHLQPGAADNLYVVYDARAVIDNPEHKCGVEETDLQTENHQHLKITDGCKIAELGLADTHDMVTALGSVTAVINHNLGILNNVQTNYRSEFDTNIEYDVVAHFVPATSGMDPFSSSTNAGTLLSSFSNWGDGGRNNGGATGGFGVDYNIASLWTDRNICFNGSCGVIGLASFGAFNNMHSVLENFTGAAASLNALQSHEMGHNWNYNHDASGSSFIMAPSLVLTDVWSAASKSAISNHIDNQTYLSDCSTEGAPVANFFTDSGGSATCSGSNVTVQFEDQSQYGATRDWTFLNGTPAASTDEKVTVTYSASATGLNYIELESTNTAGSSILQSYIDLQPAPGNQCTPSGTGGGGGTTNISFANINNNSTVSGVYQDFACSAIGDLEVSTSYTLEISTNISPAQPQNIRVYADWNDDGDFNDTGELALNTTFNNSGSFSITTPASPVLNALIRFRVINSFNNISGPCHSTNFGQTEDYSVYFGGTPVYGCTDPSADNYNANATIDDGSCSFGGNGTTWYADADGDSFGNPAVSQTSVGQPIGFVADNTDCNDANNTVFPGATEICDGLDNDCDNQIDEGLQTTYYRDLDSDSFGDPNNSIDACIQPPGFVTDNTDCDDTNNAVFPGATEVCDGIDNDCDNQIDEGVISTYYRDLDNDSFGDPNNSIEACSQPTGFVADNTDCDDSDDTVFPGATEICDGIDNDCDNQIDEGVISTYYRDLDEDDFGDPNNTIEACSQPTGFVTDNTDCNDVDNTVFPGAPELCDGQINNCNSNNLPDNEVDNDNDGYVECTIDNGGWDGTNPMMQGDDCDDNDNTVFPNAPELCDGIDNDCDNQIDENTISTYYRDLDEDDFGDPNNTIEACSQPTGYVTDNTDCNDIDNTVFPGAPELCDGQINNCNSSNLPDNEVDNDNDGYVECTVDDGGWDGSPYKLGDDCDDNDDTVYPTAPELCDGKLNNCNGNMLPTELDADNDGYVECTISNGANTNKLGDDCDDNDDTVYPTAPELCSDNVDNDCDGMINEGCGPAPDCDDINLVINNGNIMAVHRAQQTIDSDALVNLNSVLYTAGNNIDLLAPFEVVAGSVFEARIEPCNVNAQEADEPDIARSNNDAEIFNGLQQSFSNDENLSIRVIDNNKVIIDLNGIHSEIYSQFIEKVKALNTGKYILKIEGQDQTIEKTLTITQQ